MNSQEYGPVKYRWVVVTVFGLLQMVAAFVGIGAASLTQAVADSWGIGYTQANLCLVASWGVVSMIVGIPAGDWADRVGYKLPSVVGGAIVAAALIGRAFVGTWALFFGLTIAAAVGAALQRTSQGTMIRTWFPREETGKATALATALFSMGVSIGSFTHFRVLEASGWSMVWLVMGIAAAVSTLVALLFAKNRPEIPPEPRKPVPQMEGQTENFFTKAKQVLNTPNCWLLLVQFAVGTGLGQILGLFAAGLGTAGVDPATTGTTVSLFNLVGIPSTYFIPTIGFQKKKGVLTLAGTLLLSAVTYVTMFMVPIGPDLVWPAMLNTAFAGLFLAPTIAISMSVAFMQPNVTPANAGTMQAILGIVMGVTSLVMSAVVGRLVDAGGPSTAAWVVGGILVVGGLIAAFIIPEPMPEPQKAPEHEEAAAPAAAAD